MSAEPRATKANTGQKYDSSCRLPKKKKKKSEIVRFGHFVDGSTHVVNTLRVNQGEDTLKETYKNT